MFETTRREISQLKAERDYWRDQHDVEARMRTLRSLLGASKVTLEMDDRGEWIVLATVNGAERLLMESRTREPRARPTFAFEAVDWAIEQVQQAMAAATFPKPVH